MTTRHCPTIGVIGLGRQGQHHYQALKTLEQQNRVKVVAVCDTSPQVKLKNIPLYRDHLSLLKEQSPDIVVITTPNIFHRQITLDALQHHADVIKEKPLALSVGEAQVLLSEAQRQRRLILTTQQRYYYPLFQKAKQLLPLIGEPTNIYYCLTINDETPSWYWNLEQAGGGAWMNLGWHALATLQWLFGELSTVELDLTVGGRRPWEYQTDHSAYARVLVQQRVPATVFVSCVEPKEETLLVEGKQGVLWLTRTQLKCLTKTDSFTLTDAPQSDQMYVTQYQSLLQALRQRRSDSQADLALVRVVEAGVAQAQYHYHYFSGGAHAAHVQHISS